ncbi:uncharacterized protein LOC109712103 [Ananas comosus]|uniref:Uncharacterized protein LOC109712103 n=1 Tax=Ananas comosus TaxID=4615 RepID=A0A6P5F4N2_ANACO|nr:uncharacterized protein LOC109712103 [Ananas comosus]
MQPRIQEKGETAAMLLSPISQPPTAAAGDDSSRSQNGSQFTMFLTAPLQAFCFLIGISGTNINKEKYVAAEKLLSLSLKEWETTLVASDALHPVWIQALGDPFLRRFILRDPVTQVEPKMTDYWKATHLRHNGDWMDGRSKDVMNVHSASSTSDGYPISINTSIHGRLVKSSSRNELLLK